MTNISKNAFSKSFAQLFVSRSEAIGLKGVKRDTAALEFYLGAANALELLETGTFAHRYGEMLAQQAALMIAPRGYKAVLSLARGDA